MDRLTIAMEAVIEFHVALGVALGVGMHVRATATSNKDALAEEIDESEGWRRLAAHG